MLLPFKCSAATAAALLAALLVPVQARADGGFFDYLFEPGSLRLEEVIGTEVRSPRGEPLGKIQALLYDARTREVKSILLERGTFPLSALVAGDLPGHVVLDESTDSSAGATALVRKAQPELRRAGQGDRLVVDLADGRVRAAE